MSSSYEDLLARRIVATGLDLCLIFLLAWFLDFFVYAPVAALIGAAMICVRDCLPWYFDVGVSPGKSFMGLKVLGDRGQPCNVETSLKRNAFVAVPFLGYVLCSVFLRPFVGAGIAFLVTCLIAVLSLGMELFRLTQGKDGLRNGDVLAGSYVIRDAFKG